MRLYLEGGVRFTSPGRVGRSVVRAPDIKIPGARLKGLLKTAFAGILPREVLAHRKQGFMIPLGHWLRRDLRAMLEDFLGPHQVRARGLFDVAALERLKRAPLSAARTPP